MEAIAPALVPNPIVEAGFAAWPNACPAPLAALLLDQMMIAHLDALPVDRIRAFQARLGDALIRHARASSRHWAARLPDAAAIRSSADLPMLDKEGYRTIAAAGPLAVADQRAPVLPNATSGSAGMPVRFHVCAVARRLAAAHAFHNWRRQGLDDRRAMALITHKVPEHPGEHIATPDHPMVWRGARLQRRARQFDVAAHARWLAGAGVGYLVTVPAILRGMLDVYEADGGAPRLDIVLTHAESVEPDLRVRAARVLGAEIRDCYGCEEIGPIAYQCPASAERYHVAAANAVVEIVDEAGAPCAAGVLGRVIATGLNTHATPAIRYELGDLAACRWGCPCGFAGQVLERLLGRARFLLKLPSGERRHPGTFAASWLAIAPVRERRLVQVSPDIVRVEIVMDRPVTPAECARIAAMLRREISDALTYEVVQRDAIAWGPGYKRQDVLCLI